MWVLLCSFCTQLFGYADGAAPYWVDPPRLATPGLAMEQPAINSNGISANRRKATSEGLAGERSGYPGRPASQRISG
jgi:hypothetical protein